MGVAEIVRMIHHSLLAHGKAVQVIRSSAKATPRIGAAPVGIVRIPASSDPADLAAAKKAMFTVGKDITWNNSWYTDPMILGSYPEEAMPDFEKFLTTLRPGDMETIKQPLDFFGVNVYSGDTVRAAENEKGWESVKDGDGPALTTMSWRVTPDALYWGPKCFYERYNLPVVITENGMANTDWVHSDGKVHDPQRIDFLQRYLRSLGKAIEDGVPVEGYLQWSIMDNFEWAFGYKQRFGLIYVDYNTGERILKDSAYWYKQVIAENGANL
jgi:beta-glucosidase